MKRSIRRTELSIVLWLSILAGCVVPTNAAFGKTQSSKQLSAQWWQWVLSIPVSDNPLLDATGADCMVGQRGADWFLAGTVGAAATRSCEIPEGRSLFFPVANTSSFDTPNACGQGPEPLPSSFYRAINAAFIDGITNVSVVLDGQAVTTLHRERSEVFDISLPADNVFLGACGGDLPAGSYSPAVDEGIYVRLNPLAPGPHTL